MSHCWSMSQLAGEHEMSGEAVHLCLTAPIVHATAFALVLVTEAAFPQLRTIFSVNIASSPTFFVSNCLLCQFTHASKLVSTQDWRKKTHNG